MPKPYDFGSVELDVDAGAERRPATPEKDTPFRILVLGDFSARASRGARESLENRKPVAVDRDNFDDVMDHVGLSIGGVRIRDLDDFHPDRLYQRLPIFEAARKKRDQLTDPETFAKVRDQFAGWASEKPEPEPSRPPQARAVAIGSGSLLDQMVSATEARPEARSHRGDPFEQFLKAIVAPHLVPKPDPKQAELVSQFDQALAEHMRGLLHHPEFQAIESAWRGLFFLIRGLETDASLKVYMMDVSLEELHADLIASKRLEDSRMYKLAVEQTVRTPGAMPWSLIVGNFSLGLSGQDLEVLSLMAQLGKEAEAPFLAAARSIYLGCKSIADTPSPRQWKDLSGTPPWQAFEEIRRTPAGRYAGLALPRFLLRQPYGKNADAPEEFHFEEMTGVPRHEDYLWGNPVFVCALLIGQAFSEYGWEMRPGLLQDIHHLPLHVYKDADGDSHVKPCGETLLTTEAATIMIERGLIPLLTMKDTDTVRVGGFRSIAPDNKLLKGRWPQA